MIDLIKTDKNGIKSFESIGKKFDPNFHQALNEVESEQEDGIVINEIDSNGFNNTNFKEMRLSIPNMSIEMMRILNYSNRVF